jgi:hypothetical protein
MDSIIQVSIPKYRCTIHDPSPPQSEYKEKKKKKKKEVPIGP